MDELQQIRQRLTEAPVIHPPEPWKVVGSLPVPGGITEVGFDEEHDHLLILTGHERSIVDTTTGRRLARDTGVEHRASWYGPHDLVGHGFGPLHGRRIAMTGVTGGGLPLITRDGWIAHRLGLAWPEEYLILMAPYHSIYQPTAEFWKLAALRDPIAYGFSFSGKSLIIATSEDVTMYTRE